GLVSRRPSPGPEPPATRAARTGIRFGGVDGRRRLEGKDYWSGEPEPITATGTTPMSDSRLDDRLRFTSGVSLLAFAASVGMGWMFWALLTLPPVTPDTEVERVKARFWHVATIVMMGFGSVSCLLLGLWMLLLSWRTVRDFRSSPFTIQTRVGAETG